MRYPGFLIFSAISLFCLSSVSWAQSPAGEYLRSHPTFVEPFREVVRNAAAATVRIRCDGKDACLGVSIDGDGWILTKAHDLKGKITCVLSDGQTLDARLVGVDETHDLAMLNVPVRLLHIASLSDSKHVAAGSWVASSGLGKDPVAIGVVGVATRKVREAYLGVQIDSVLQGVLIQQTMKDGAAAKAGLAPKDIVLAVNGTKINDVDHFQELLAERVPGDKIALTVRRGKTDLTLKAILQSREQIGGFRAEFQNRMGSELSTRRSGYPIILQHDSVLKPSDCGGPLVDLKGRVVGINISRAGRVETWAIPAEVVQPLIPELQSGRLAPKEKKAER
jgi:serine protease Do